MHKNNTHNKQVYEPNMHGVAKKASVSQSTVSRVFNHDKSISQETSDRVMEAAKAIGYRPRKSLSVRKKNRTVVLGFTVSLHKHMAENPTIVDLIHGVERQAKEQGYTVLIHSLGYDVALANSGTVDLPDQFEDGRADGMIILGHAPEALFETLSQRRFPFVAIEAAMGYSQANIVMPDHYTVGYLATKHLLDLGHRRIAYVGTPSEYYSISLQACAYRAAMLAAGISEGDQLVVETDIQTFAELQGGRSIADKILSMSDRPTGMVFSGEIEAAQALRMFRDHGLAVPEDISIVASSSSARVLCKSTRPRLTSVCCVSDEYLGRSAVMRLLDILRDTSERPGRKEILPVQLVIEGSTAALRAK